MEIENNRKYVSFIALKLIKNEYTMNLFKVLYSNKVYYVLVRIASIALTTVL